jgi:phosphoadenosine phosphosulfate reductase
MNAASTNMAPAYNPADPVAALAAFRRHVPGRIVFTTSFGIEDQAITHMILSQSLDIAVVTLDTGRLFPETYDVWAATEARYGARIEAVHPDADDLGRLVASQGVNGFRSSIEARKACCDMRKVAPLGRALAGASGWVTGLRADQSQARAAVEVLSANPSHGIPKLNPLISWSRQQAVAYVDEHGVPSNALHGRGFPSIGCAPCTRAVKPGEAERAGRWWWEQEGEGIASQKECGLHVGADGRPGRLHPAEGRP